MRTCSHENRRRSLPKESRRGPALLLLAALWLLPTGDLVAQQNEKDPSESDRVERSQARESDDESSGEESDQIAQKEDPEESDPTAEQSDQADPCEVSAPDEEAGLDQFRREVFETVCESAAWFDGFFGSRRFDEEARRTHGRVGAQVVYDEHEGTEVDGVLKVRVDFPNVDERINAFLDRDDEEGFITGAEDDLGFLPTFFAREGSRDWLLGLGYQPVGSDRSSLDFDVGVEVETPLDPFVRARYRYYWLISDDNLLRARQSVYWTNQRDLGSATRIDFERPVSQTTLARWAGSIVFDSLTEGADWDTGVTIYHGFTDDSAIAWFIGIDGETGRDVPIENYGTIITYRQRMLREWFFGELITGVTWPRDTLEQERELAWQLGFGFEIQFSGEDLGIGGRSAP